MKASVLIPAYQARPYILTALQSVAAQTHGNWEILVVEDGSRDGTESIVEAFAATCGQTVVYRNMGTTAESAQCAIDCSNSQVEMSWRFSMPMTVGNPPTWNSPWRKSAQAAIGL